MTDAEQVEAAVRNLDVPWMLMQDNEAGAGWDWIVVVPGGENIVGLSEVVARRIATDHSASLAAASATASPTTGERMARAIEALLPEIEEAEIGHGGGSHDDECPTCAAIKEAGAALAAYRSASAPEPMAGAVDDDRQMKFAHAVNNAVNDAIDRGINESRAIAAFVSCHPEVKAMLAASPPPPDGWRGIESAPRDAPLLILRRGSHVTAGCWRDKEGRGTSAQWVSWDGGFNVNGPPTHWCPLPSPPGEELGKG